LYAFERNGGPDQLPCIRARWKISSKWRYASANNEIEKMFTYSIDFTGDDEKLRIWDVERKKCYQVIGDGLERWGQVTCIQWLHGFSENCEVVSLEPVGDFF
jgi:hypothetical protein